MESLAVEKAIAAVLAGQPVLLPADGVYGLCAAAGEVSTRRLYELKGRGESQPTAIIAASVEKLFETVPELDPRDRVIVRTLLPGAFTLVLSNPARRLPWLNGAQRDAIGIRVAELPSAAQQVLDAVEVVAATSANDPGEPAAASLSQVPLRIRERCGAELDAGELSGRASTVIDFTGAEPVVLREGAGGSAEALARVAEALRRVAATPTPGPGTA